MPKDKDDEDKKAVKDEDEIPHNLADFLRLVWRKLIGIFYSEEDNYEYIKTGTFRWAKELKIFVILVSVVYLTVCVIMQLPVYFSFDKLSKFYSVAYWLMDNTYMLPMLSIVFLYELLWFIDGEHKEAEEPEELTVSFVEKKRDKKVSDYSKAKSALLDKYSEKYDIKHFDASVMGGKSTYNLSEKDVAIQNLARSIRANKGFVNGDYMQSIEYMLDGRHVLFDSSIYSSLGEYVIHYLFVNMSFGKRVLFICKDKKEIENAMAYLDKGFSQITKTQQNLWRLGTYEKLHEGAVPDVLFLTPEQFLETSLFTDGKDFFEHLTDVFVLDADKIITTNNYYCLIIAKKLAKATSGSAEGSTDSGRLSAVAAKRLRYSFFSSGHIQALGNSLRQFFNLEDAPLETLHSFGLAAKTEVFVWHTGMSSTLYVDNGANQVALEVQIAKDVSNVGISDINLISDTAMYSSQLNEINSITLNSCDLSGHSVGYVIVADDCFNLPNAIYNYSRFSGRKSSVLHVVSKPYLLRDYFTAKAEEYVSHFELIGKTMSEHAETTRANIIILLCDAVNGIERSAFIKRATDLLGNILPDGETDCPCGGIPDLDECVRLCYKVALNSSTDYEPQYSLRKEYTSEHELKMFVYIKDYDELFERLLDSTRTVTLKFLNTQSVENIPVFKDEVVQHFIPGQVVVRNNHSYTIKDMSVEDGVLILDDTGSSINVPMDYLQTRLYSINNAEHVNSFGNDYRAKNNVVSHLELSVYNADITVDTVGYYSIEEAVQSVDLAKPNFAKYVNLTGNNELLKKIKRDIRTKMLVIEMDINEGSDPRISYSLAVILQEFMKTVFPHQYRCVSVCPLFDDADDEEFFREETAVRDLYPRIIGKFSTETEEDQKEKSDKKGVIRLAIIEDVQGGNGVVETLIDSNGIMVTNLLHVVADFLGWYKTADGQRCRYLNFGYDHQPAVFDMDKLEGIVRQFKHDIERSELVRLYDSDACFFCHRPVSENDGMILEDGRKICPECLENSVSTFEELDKCLADVLKAIKDNTEVADTFPKDISVDFVSTAELRERYKGNEENIPVGYRNHITNCIYVEYGLPKVAVYSTIAIMVTKLWQDCNVVNDGGELLEAHPDLVEIQVLRNTGHTAESEALNALQESNEGLAELRKALDEKGNEDSFAYFLGVSGKNNTDDPQLNDDDDDDDVIFIAERDPATLPRFYYNKLNDDEKAVYDQIYNAINGFAESTGAPVREINNEKCYDIIKIVLMDNPDIFWCANPAASLSVDSSQMVKNIIFKYTMSKSEKKRRTRQIEKAVKPFIKGIKETMSDFEVALRAHENIVELIDYDSIGLDIQEKDPDRFNKPDNLRSVYGVFVEEKAVCAGYARAYQYLLNRLGIECAYVKGQCNDGEWHAWNLIKLEGEYYYVDVTWDDHSNTEIRKNTSAEVSYDYFCITTDELLKSRNIHNADTYPECTAIKCNYFVKKKLFFKNYDAQKMAKIVSAAVNAGKKEIAIKAENPRVLSVVREHLVTHNGMRDILDSISDKNRRLSYTYYSNDDLNVLHIIIG